MSDHIPTCEHGYMHPCFICDGPDAVFPPMGSAIEPPPSLSGDVTDARIAAPMERIRDAIRRRVDDAIRAMVENRPQISTTIRIEFEDLNEVLDSHRSLLAALRDSQAEVARLRASLDAERSYGTQTKENLDKAEVECIALHNLVAELRVAAAGAVTLMIQMQRDLTASRAAASL